MKTLNLTKITECNLGQYIIYRNEENGQLPEEMKQKFIKDNYIIDKECLYLKEKENNQYVAQGNGYYLTLEYKVNKNVLCVNYNKKGKQKLYVIKVA